MCGWEGVSSGAGVGGWGGLVWGDPVLKEWYEVCQPGVEGAGDQPAQVYPVHLVYVRLVV